MDSVIHCFQYFCVLNNNAATCITAFDKQVGEIISNMSSFTRLWVNKVYSVFLRWKNNEFSGARNLKKNIKTYSNEIKCPEATFWRALVTEPKAFWAPSKILCSILTHVSPISKTPSAKSRSQIEVFSIHWATWKWIINWEVCLNIYVLRGFLAEEFKSFKIWHQFIYFWFWSKIWILWTI